jgi:peptidoglycan/LPS O-acetylase OafA/YrhL
VNPLAWWLSLPAAIREPIRSAAFSAFLAIQTAFLALLGAAIADGHATSPADLSGYIYTHLWGAALGLVLPAAYRARQKSIAVANTIQLLDGTTAVVTPPKGS